MAYRPITRMDEGSKGGRNSVLAIWRCGCNPDHSAYSCRRRGQKRGTKYNGVDTGSPATSGSQNP